MPRLTGTRSVSNWRDRLPFAVLVDDEVLGAESRHEMPDASVTVALTLTRSTDVLNENPGRCCASSGRAETRRQESDRADASLMLHDRRASTYLVRWRLVRRPPGDRHAARRRRRRAGTRRGSARVRLTAGIATENVDDAPGAARSRSIRVRSVASTWPDRSKRSTTASTFVNGAAVCGIPQRASDDQTAGARLVLERDELDRDARRTPVAACAGDCRRRTGNGAASTRCPKA